MRHIAILSFLLLFCAALQAQTQNLKLGNAIQRTPMPNNLDIHYEYRFHDRFSISSGLTYHFKQRLQEKVYYEVGVTDELQQVHLSGTNYFLFIPISSNQGAPPSKETKVTHNFIHGLEMDLSMRYYFAYLHKSTGHRKKDGLYIEVKGGGIKGCSDTYTQKIQRYKVGSQYSYSDGIIPFIGSSSTYQNYQVRTETKLQRNKTFGFWGVNVGMQLVPKKHFTVDLYGGIRKGFTPSLNRHTTPKTSPDVGLRVGYTF